MATGVCEQLNKQHGCRGATDVRALLVGMRATSPSADPKNGSPTAQVSGKSGETASSKPVASDSGHVADPTTEINEIEKVTIEAHLREMLSRREHDIRVSELHALVSIFHDKNAGRERPKASTTQRRPRGAGERHHGPPAAPSAPLARHVS